MRHIPRVLNCTAVKLFAVLDEATELSMTGTCDQAMQRSGAITQLAIGQKSEGTGFALYYCDNDWKTLDTRYFGSLDEAVRIVDVEYPALPVKWLKPQEAARRRGKYALEPRCAFCDKTFPGGEKLIAGDGACICYGCVDFYYKRYIIKPGQQRVVSALHPLN